MASRDCRNFDEKNTGTKWAYAASCDQRAEHCKDCPMFDKTAVQIRHVDFGIFQGCIDGETFWYPYTNTPNLGICPTTKERAYEFINDLCEINPELSLDQFIIEPLDKKLFSSMQ